ncbi:MAG: RHS repeat-associated core domain-containing protein [Planctomycetaceae bacterium]|nr:RHS repeat-associated core domain-containing protein [Planctomycetaceae bacterium]
MTLTTYQWDPVTDQLLSEDDGTSRTDYTHEPNLYGDLISQTDGANTRFYHFDARGDTRQITDEIEAVTDSWTYDAWGNVLSRTGTTATPFQFVGKLGYAFDAAVEVNYVRARWFSSTLATWLSSDPARSDESYTLYSYAHGNPILSIDPSGLITVTRQRGGCQGPCGKVVHAWDFTLTRKDVDFAKKHCKPDPSTGKTPAYIVQHIKKEAVCNSDCCDSSWRFPLTLPETDSFWEAFYISDIHSQASPDDPQPGIQKAVGFTDVWIQPDMRTSRGKSQTTGTLRLYCVFGGSRPSGWLHGGQGGFTVCSESEVNAAADTPCEFKPPRCPAGQLPFTRKPPLFWGGGLGLPHAKIVLDTKWDCCAAKKYTDVEMKGVANPVSSSPACR